MKRSFLIFGACFLFTHSAFCAEVLSEKSETSLDVGEIKHEKIESAQKPELVSNTLYFCTAADEQYFPWLLSLIGSIHKVNFEALGEIAVFDLGFAAWQRALLNVMEKVHVYFLDTAHPKRKELLTSFKTSDHGRTARGWYAWKPVVIKQALDMFPYVLYLDAGTVALKRLDNLFKHIQRKGYFLLEDQKWGI